MWKKRVVVAAAAALMAVGLLAGCGSDSSNDSGANKNVQSRGRSTR